MEPLEALATSIPTWHVLLDDLNGKIASRQRELAEAEDYKPSQPSLKNKGSTESLRPKNDDEVSPDIDTTMSSTDAPPQTDTPPPTVKPPAPTPPNPPANPPPIQRPGPHRAKAVPAKGLPALSPPAPRKRKPSSLASADSGKPTNRTRSMIIVYYDSAVQIALEELVKHISASRNSMRKGKMAARMATMRHLAELEALDDDADDLPPPPAALPNPNAFLGSAALAHDILAAATPGDADDDGLPLPMLQFVSTRRMGPMRDLVTSKSASAAARASLAKDKKPGGPGGGPGVGGGHISFHRPSAAASPSSANIFDELDAGLEWCQSMCEHAAHQFLRDGRCDQEVAGVKARLGEVLERAQRGLQEGGAEGKEKAPGDLAAVARAGDGRSVDEGGATLPRTMRPIQIRRAGDRLAEKPAAAAAQMPAQPLSGGDPMEIPVAKAPERLFEKPVLRRVEAAPGRPDDARLGDAIVVLTADPIEADDDGDDVMGEDELRNEFAALIARNSKYRR